MENLLWQQRGMEMILEDNTREMKLEFWSRWEMKLEVSSLMVMAVIWQHSGMSLILGWNKWGRKL